MNDELFSNVYEMKELPFEINGSFDWLEKQDIHDEHIGVEKETELESRLSLLLESTDDNGILIPVEFQEFIQNKKLHSRIRSVTDCFLDLSASSLPLADVGHFARFLSDSQGCGFWYLFSESKNKDSKVIFSTEYFDSNGMNYDVSEIEESDFAVEANSFEEFICRFWLENEILFASYDETEPPNVDEKFLELYSS